jgi:hypothetical protein
MDAVRRFTAGVRVLAAGHSRRVWLLWGLAILLLVLTPFALLDPAAWVFVLDPELAAIVALVGFAGVRSGAVRLLQQPLTLLARRGRG